MTSLSPRNEQTTVERSTELRDGVLPLPNLDDGYARALLLGTTGAGKTTLVRQLIGTDPETERFPSTSTAKTTVADTEIVVDRAALGWSAVITFVPRLEVLAALQDCFGHVARGVLDGRRETELLRRLLEHPEQRFRFQYILGNIRSSRPETEEATTDADERVRQIAFGSLNAIRTFVSRAHEIVEKEAHEADRTLSAESLREEVEAQVEHDLAHDPQLLDYAETLIDEMQERFDLIKVGDLELEDGWPVRWHWSSGDRETFLDTVNYFSSNYAPRFGQLLTPLVNGIRVRGPFEPPTLPDGSLGFTLIDVEGLGHTPASSSSVSGRLVQYFDEVDAIVLVDNGTQPMQAAPIAAMRAVLTSGHLDKLTLAFTHLDQVVGDNLLTAEDREEHVLSSAENVVVALGRELGTRDDQRLRAVVEDRTVFLGGLHERLSGGDVESSRTHAGLGRLLSLACTVPEPPDPSESRPSYLKADFEAAIRGSIGTFRTRWMGILGRETVPGVPKEHWARVKALSRRLAELHRDEYDDLRPVADLATATREAMYHVIRHPVTWTPGEPPDPTRNEILDRFTNEVSARLSQIGRRRVWLDRTGKWLEAYRESGKGSTFVRARILDAEVLTPAAPAVVEPNAYVTEVLQLLEEVSADQGVLLR